MGKKIAAFAFSAITFLIGRANAQQFYETLPSNRDLTVSTAVGVVQLYDGFYKLETETVDADDFHANVRLTKTDTSGTVRWCKRFDAGIDTSLVPVSIHATPNSHLLVLGQLSFDNSTAAPIGQCLLELDSSGAVVREVLVDGFYASISTDVVFINDSIVMFAGWNGSPVLPVLIRVNLSTQEVDAFTVDFTLAGDQISSLRLHGGKLSLTFDNGGHLLLDTALNVLQRRLYTLNPSLGYLSHALLANGDRVFVDNRISGGFGAGVFRIFRTDSTGALKWAENVSSEFEDTVSSFVNHFDVLGTLGLAEDPAGNITAFMYDEGSTCVAFRFDSGGNLLDDRTIPATAALLAADGGFLCAKNGSTGQPIFALLKPGAAFDCDSALYATVTPGTDSLSDSATEVVVTSIAAATSPIALHISDTILTAVNYCIAATAVLQSPSRCGLVVYPNPANDVLHIACSAGFSGEAATICDVAGRELLECPLGGTITEVDISALSSGLYLVKVATPQGIVVAKLLK